MISNNSRCQLFDVSGKSKGVPKTFLLRNTFPSTASAKLISKRSKNSSLYTQLFGSGGARL